MKVNFTAEVPLGNIELGECFRWRQNIYIKCFLSEAMSEQLQKNEELYDRKKHSIVLDLEYGDVSIVDDSTLVNPLNMEVVPR
jgi:hypothetical protein